MGKIHCVTDHLSVAFFTMVTMFTCVMSSSLYQQPIAKCRFVTQFAACLVMVSGTKMNDGFSFRAPTAFQPADLDSTSKNKSLLALCETCLLSSGKMESILSHEVNTAITHVTLSVPLLDEPGGT